MTKCTALLDANILYPISIRDLHTRLALAGTFRGRCTEDIHREWMDVCREKRPEMTPERLEQIRAGINESLRDGLITGYEHLIPGLQMSAEKDKHVLAAAIVGKCDVIVTNNIKHFPDEELAPYGIAAQDPDDFLLGLLSMYPGTFCRVIRKIRSLLDPPHSIGQYLSNLEERQKLQQTAAELKLAKYADLL